MSKAVAVVGTEIVTALGAGLESNWAGLLNKAVGIKQLSTMIRPQYTTDVAAAIPEEALKTVFAELGEDSVSTAYALSLWTARGALNASGVNPDETMLILSTTKADLPEFESTLSAQPSSSPKRFNLGVMAADLAARLSLGGGSIAVSNACASGLIALMQGARLIQRDAAKHVVVVGVDVLSDFVISGFSSLRALAPKPARPFDSARDGLSLGEGAGAIVLSSESDSSDSIFLQGWSCTNDGEHITAPSREGKGLQRAIIGALDMAMASRESIGYINAHGTGTEYNDEMEAQAFAAVFGETDAPPVTSMKGNLGHTLGAAGVIESALSFLVIESGVIPPSAGFETLGVTKTIHVPHESVAFDRNQRVLSTKSGFGGVNAAVVFGRGVAE